jgi:hypothetical protein
MNLSSNPNRRAALPARPGEHRIAVHPGSRPDPAERKLDRSLRQSAGIAQAAIHTAAAQLRRDFAACERAGCCLGRGAPLPGDPASRSAWDRFGRLAAAGEACQRHEGCWCRAAYAIAQDARQATLSLQHICHGLWSRRQAFERQKKDRPAEALVWVGR